MTDQQGADPSTRRDPAELAAAMGRIAQRSQDLVTRFLRDQAVNPWGPGAKTNEGALDPLNIGTAFLDMTTRMARDPGAFIEAQMTLWQDYLALWQHTTRRLMGQAIEPTI